MNPVQMGKLLRGGGRAFVLTALLGTGCSVPLLPRESRVQESPWSCFAEAKAAYDNVEIDVTTESQLKELGIDPFVTPNVEILTYLDIQERFLPNAAVKFADLDMGVQRCIAARELCLGYRVAPGSRQEQRHGNVILDLLQFHQQTSIEGWRFEGLIIMVDGVVTYKLWDGQPLIKEERDYLDPLGPFRDVLRLLKLV